MRIAENSFFLLMSYSKDDTIFSVVVRKRPTLANAGPLLIGLMAQLLIEKGALKNRILIKSEDAYLSRDLQSIGFRWCGYAKANGTLVPGFDFSVELIELSLTMNLGLTEGQVLYRAFAPHELSADLQTGTHEWMHVCNQFERVVPNVSYNSLGSHPIYAEEWSEGKSGYPTRHEIDDVKLDTHSGLGRSKITLSNFSSCSPLQFDEIHSLVEKSLGSSGPRDSCPFSVAGNLHSELAYVLLCLSNGEMYSAFYHQRIHDMAQKRVNDVDCEMFFQLCFSQRRYTDCRTWMIPLIRFKRFGERYGHRGRRYAMMAGGAWLHQLELCAALEGVGTRILGAFDEVALLNLFGLPGDNFLVPSVIGFGKLP